MTKRLRLPTIMAFLLSVMIMISACSGGTGNSGANGAGSASTSSKQETSSGTNAGSGNDNSDPEPVKLSIAWWGSQTRHDYTQKLLDLYTELNPHVTFEATPSGWDGYFDKLSAQAAGGKLPDIIQMDYQYIATFSNNDLLADLQPFVDNQTLDLGRVDENIVGSGRVNGELTGIAISSTAMAVTYNPDVFANAGVEAPIPEWTWEQFIDAMTRIADNTGKLGTESLIDTQTFSYWVRQHGQHLFKEDGSALGYEDDAIMVEFINMVKSLQDNKSMPTPDERAQYESRGKEAMPVVTGDAGVRFDWANFTVITAGSNPNLKLVTPPLKGGGENGLWIKPGMFFSVAESSNHKEEDVKFINWFINSKEANDIIAAERGIPVSSEIRDYLKTSLTPQQQDMFDYLNVALQYSSPIDPPEPSGFAEVSKEFIDAVNKVMYDQISPEEAAQNFRKVANQILERNAN